MFKKVAIIYLLWGDEPKKYLVRTLVSVNRQSYDKTNLSLIIPYNPTETTNQLAFIEATVAEYKDKISIKILPQTSNIGFSAGNNVGIQFALDHGADYIFLHNGDGYLSDTSIEEIVRVMVSDETIGQVQSMILLNNQPDKINTSGDCWQYLGIGYCRDYQKNLSEFKNSGEIGYASGTATLMRADLLKKYGLWSNDFFLYHEDVDYSLRLRSLGYKIVLAEKSIFYHDYEFGRNKKKYFWLERNRYAIKLIYYKIPTLVLLLPLEILYNFGLIFFAFFSGWFLDLLRVYVYWLQPKNWTTWLVLRKKIQTGRVIKDKDLLRQAVNTVNTEQIGSKFILLPANIVFAVYGFLLRLVVWW